MCSAVRHHLSALVVTFLWATATAAQTQSVELSRLQREEAARESREKTPELFEAMGIRPGAVVADIGAGEGFSRFGWHVRLVRTAVSSRSMSTLA